MPSQEFGSSALSVDVLQVFAVDVWRRQCEARAKDIRSTAELYKELSNNLSEGVRFYNSLQVRLTGSCHTTEISGTISY